MDSAQLVRTRKRLQGVACFEISWLRFGKHLDSVSVSDQASTVFCLKPSARLPSVLATEQQRQQAGNNPRSWLAPMLIMEQRSGRSRVPG